MKKINRWLVLFLTLSVAVAIGTFGGESNFLNAAASVPKTKSNTMVTIKTGTGESGGGYTNAGIKGEYFSNSNLTGTPSFTRNDVRVDFDFGNQAVVGGSIAEPYKSFPNQDFSVRWTGKIIPKYNETYSFRSYSDGVRIMVDGKKIIDTWNKKQIKPFWSNNGTIKLISGKSYDIKIEYHHKTGNAAVKVVWSSPSVVEEVIDPLIETGLNTTDWGEAFTDIVKCARNNWENTDLDKNGWPTGDGEYVFQESLNTGLDIDPLMEGTIAFSFKGKADLEVMGNCDALDYKYDQKTNTTFGTFNGKPNGWNASYFKFKNASRDGKIGGSGGITDLKLMRPLYPGAKKSFGEDTLFIPKMKEALSHFTVFRVNLNNANQEKEWVDRTLPSYFNQNGGKQNAWETEYGDNITDNGASWEHKIMLCNETGKDLYINIPMMATGRNLTDKNSYVYKLAQLIKYGSDGTNPYTSLQKNPLYPPLNSNLRVYVELSNENWNCLSGAFMQYWHLDRMLEEDKKANNEDYKIINYDLDNEDNQFVQRSRKAALRIVQISTIFRSVYGDQQMMTKVRPIYEYQYNNNNGTAEIPLGFIDDYFNNADGIKHVQMQHPVNYYLWGAGGATYYGAKNGNGLTDLIKDSSFEATAVNGYKYRPSSEWLFSSNAGIAHNGSSLKNPDALKNLDTSTDLGIQCAFIQGVESENGSISMDVTFPKTQISDVYALCFRAVNRIKDGATEADVQNLRVYFDGKDITAKTYSNGDGYTPPGYNPEVPWMGRNVAWANSEYYFTNTVKVKAGSKHTIRIEGASTSGDQMAFLDDIRVTSVDALMAGGIPDAGQAAGQVTSGTYQYELDGQAMWAKAYGLKYIAYESGWSLGGDDGGSPLQNYAKYYGVQTKEAQRNVMKAFQKAGGQVNTLGTYAQWPSWGDHLAEQGLLNVAEYPIIQGVDEAQNRLPSEVTNGTLVPAIIEGNRYEQNEKGGTNMYFRAENGAKSRYALRANQAGFYELSIKADTFMSKTNIDVYSNGVFCGNIDLDKSPEGTVTTFKVSKTIKITLLKGLNVITLAARNSTDTNIEWIKIDKINTQK